MKLLLIGFSFLLMSCTGHYYTEKQSKALSVSVYATKDSFMMGRMDLVDPYLNQICEIVTPPSIIDRIKIQSIIVNNERKLVVPARYNNQKVLVVGSDEYNALIKIKNISEQLVTDKKNLQEQVENVNAQLKKQAEATNQMILDLAAKDATIKEQNSEIFKKNIIIGLLAMFVGFKILRIFI